MKEHVPAKRQSSSTLPLGRSLLPVRTPLQPKEAEGIGRSPKVTIAETGHSFSNLALTPIQAKLTIGAPNDVYEQEADRVAAQVVQRLNAPPPNPPSPARSQSDPSVQRETLPDDDELQMKPMADQIQRVDMPEEDELQMKSMVQQQAGGDAVTASANLESAIQQARSGGRPLADPIRQPIEQAFGADFSGVKVHTDTQSDKLNRSIQAKAFTTGQDIFFRQGAYQPENRGGQELLAHELTHVVQQTGGTVQRTTLSDKKKTNVGIRLIRHGYERSHSKSPPASTDHELIQRAVQVQVMWALPGTPGYAPGTVHISEISGRPNGPQHDHTAAYVLFAWEVRNAVEGKTFFEAVEAIQKVVGRVDSLPGFTEGTPLEIANRTDATNELWNDIDDVIVDPTIPPWNNPLYHSQFLARFMERYIEIRNTIPLTAIQGQPGGSGKNEGAGATYIDKFVRDNAAVINIPSGAANGNDVEHLSYAMWQTWDYRPTSPPQNNAEINEVAKILAQWYLQVYRAYPRMPETWSPDILTELLSDWDGAEAIQWGWSPAKKTLFHTEVQRLISGAELHH